MIAQFARSTISIMVLLALIFLAWGLDPFGFMFGQ
jgi:hypothetical protein